MGILNKIKVSKDAVAIPERVGGESFILDTNMYKAKVVLAFIGEYASGALYLEAHFEIEGRKNKYVEKLLLTNKQHETTYVNKKTGQNTLFASFTTADNLSLLTTGKGILDQDISKRTVKLYDYDAREEREKEVDACMDMHGKPVNLLIRRTVEDKKTLVSEEWVATGETRFENTIANVADEAGFTVNEIQQDLKEPLFTVAWLAKWQGVITDNVMGAKAGGNTAAESVQAKSVTI